MMNGVGPLSGVVFINQHSSIIIVFVPNSSVNGRAKRRKSSAGIAQVSQRGEMGRAWPRSP